MKEHNALKQSASAATAKGQPHRSALKAPDVLAIGNKDPKRAYRWVSKAILDKAGGFDFRGWEVLNEASSHGETMMSQWGIHSNGTELRNGDLVACYMPIERNQEKRAILKEANNSLGAYLKNLRSNIKRTGAGVEGSVQVQRDGVTETY